MSSLTDYSKNKIVDHILGTTAFSIPTCYLALFTADPTSAGLLADELPNTNNYSRVLVSGNMSAASSSMSKNTTAISFPTASADWSEASYVALIDSGVHGSGNILMYKELSPAVTVLNGTNFQVEIGNYRFYMD